MEVIIPEVVIEAFYRELIWIYSKEPTNSSPNKQYQLEKLHISEIWTQLLSINLVILQNITA